MSNQIIWNTEYNAIKEKAYINGTQENLMRLAAELDKSGISYSGRISDYRSAITVEAADRARTLEIMKGILNAAKENVPEDNSEKNIIGNAEYRYISNKRYVRGETEAILRTADRLTAENISFSGRIKGDTVTLTVSGDETQELVKRYFAEEKNRIENVQSAYFLALSSDTFEDGYYISEVNATTGEEVAPYRSSFGDISMFVSVDSAVRYAKDTGITLSNTDEQLSEWRRTEAEAEAEKEGQLNLSRSREIIKRLPMTEKGEYEEHFVLRETSVDWIYFNPEGADGKGQFIVTTLYGQDILNAYIARSNVDDYNKFGQGVFIEVMENLGQIVVNADTAGFERLADNFIKSRGNENVIVSEPLVSGNKYDSNFERIINLLENHFEDVRKYKENHITEASEDIFVNGFEGRWNVIDSDVIDDRKLLGNYVPDESLPLSEQLYEIAERELADYENSLDTVEKAKAAAYELSFKRDILSYIENELAEDITDPDVEDSCRRLISSGYPLDTFYRDWLKNEYDNRMEAIRMTAADTFRKEIPQNEYKLEADTKEYIIDGQEGAWSVVNYAEINGRQLFELESDNYGYTPEVGHIIADVAGNILAENVHNGFENFYSAEKSPVRNTDKDLEFTVTDTAHYVDIAGFNNVPEFLKEKVITPQKSAFDTAVELINEYAEREFGEAANFSNTDHVDLAYTTHEITELPIEVYADLDTFRIVTECDGKLAEEKLFNSLDDMNGALGNLDFNELVYVPDDIIDRLTDKDKNASPVGINETLVHNAFHDRSNAEEAEQENSAQEQKTNFPVGTNEEQTAKFVTSLRDKYDPYHTTLFYEYKGYEYQVENFGVKQALGESLKEQHQREQRRIDDMINNSTPILPPSNDVENAMQEFWNYVNDLKTVSNQYNSYLIVQDVVYALQDLLNNSAENYDWKNYSEVFNKVLDSNVHTDVALPLYKSSADEILSAAAERKVISADNIAKALSNLELVLQNSHLLKNPEEKVEQISFFDSTPIRKSSDEIGFYSSAGEILQDKKENSPVGNDSQEEASEKETTVDYTITDKNYGTEGGAKARFANNVAAIKLLKSIEKENRTATPEEQEILAKYVGWGGIANAFDSRKPDWSKEYTELKDLLTDEEYRAARASTMNAHYTSPMVINAIYSALDNMGFDGGKILEIIIPKWIQGIGKIKKCAFAV